MTAAKVGQIFQENDPVGTTNLVGVFLDATNHCFQRKASGQAKPNGETILVITDGEPDDRKAVFEVVINASGKINQRWGTSNFSNSSGYTQATKFLKALDEQLQSVGAKFDICDTVTLDELEEMSLTEVLMNAITD